MPPALVEQYGVVSGECARAMADGLPGRDRRDVRPGHDGRRRPRLAGGQAGRARSSSGSPAPTASRRLTMELVGDRHQIQDRACREALSALCGILRGEQPPLG